MPRINLCTYICVEIFGHLFTRVMRLMRLLSIDAAVEPEELHELLLYIVLHP